MRGGWLKIHFVPTLRKTPSTETVFLLSLCLSGHTSRDRVLSAQENYAQLWVLTQPHWAHAPFKILFSCEEPTYFPAFFHVLIREHVNGMSVVSPFSVAHNSTSWINSERSCLVCIGQAHTPLLTLKLKHFVNIHTLVSGPSYSRAGGKNRTMAFRRATDTVIPQTTYLVLFNQGIYFHCAG